MTLLVRDEADILRRNIEYHLEQGVDGIVAVDNGSVDATREILLDFQKQGVLTVFDEPARTFAQSEWVTRAALFARDRMGADWLLNNDADEFWTSAHRSLKDVCLAATARVLNCRRLNYMVAHEELGTDGDLENLVYRVAEPVGWRPLQDIYTDALPCPYYYLALPGKVLVRTKGLYKIGQGNHSARYLDKAERCEDVPVEILHFPIRSRPQFERKVVQGGQAYEANRELPEHVGWHWRRWYRMYCGHGLDPVLADALPGRDRLQADIGTGAVVEDRRFGEATVGTVARP